MSKYLISTVETYRVDTEEQVEQIFEEAKNATEYTLSKYGCTYKELKQKGDVIDDWYRVTLTKVFTNEKEPDRSVDINYGTGGYENAF